MSTAFFEAVHADPWSDDFVDLDTLNAAASGAIERCIRQLRDAGRADPGALRSSSMVVLGPPGAGKTHLFARLRKRLGPRAVFVHVRPLVHGPMTPRFLLGEVVRQLGYQTQGLRQLDALVGSLLAHVAGEDTTYPNTFLSLYQPMPPSERGELLERALDRVLELWPEADEAYLRRLLEAPFASGGKQRALMAWLAGRDCDVTQLERIGATGSLGDELAMPALRTLGVSAAIGAPLVLVFDQLENLIEGEEPGPRLLGYANLSAELVDAVRGLLTVHMALDTEWDRAIEPTLNLAQRSRIVGRRALLELPDASQRESLLRLFVERLPDRAAPFPWPFSEAACERWCQAAGTTPRMLLIACRSALEGGPEVTDAPDAGLAGTDGAEDAAASADDLEAEWQSRLEAARRLLADAAEQRTSIEPGRLVDGLIAAGFFLPGAALKAAKQADPAQLRLCQPAGEIAVAYLHHSHHRSVGAALSRLAGLAARGPVVALRERAREFPPTWKETQRRRQELLATRRARLVWVEQEDVARLLALDELLQGARSRDVSDARGQPIPEAVVMDWAATHLNVAAWGVCVGLTGTAEARGSDAPEGATLDEEVEPIPAPPAAVSTGIAAGVARRLRLASLDRVVREVARMDPRATRAAIVAELQSANGVRFLGRNIVYWGEEA